MTIIFSQIKNCCYDGWCIDQSGSKNRGHSTVGGRKLLEGDHSVIIIIFVLQSGNYTDLIFRNVKGFKIIHKMYHREGGV